MHDEQLDTELKKGSLKQNGVHLQDHEYITVKLFLELGYDIELIPPSRIKGFRMPDLMMQGIPWEMKSPQGGGRNTIKHTLQDAGQQSRNIILDLQRCRLSDEQVIKEAKYFLKMSKSIRQIKIVTSSKKIIDLSK